MAEGKVGEGPKPGDRRYSGRAKRIAHTAHGGDMVGDKRKLPKKVGISTKSGGSRIVPVAATLGGDSTVKPVNGGAKRTTPKAMKVGEW